MNIKKIVVSAAMIISLSGCVSDNVISQEEMKLQDKADNVVSSVLFDHDLDSYASYNIRKNGFVVISFDPSVPPHKYTEVVGILRDSSDINRVKAEVKGAEVCPLVPR